MDPLESISAPAPQFSKAEALHTLQAEFGLQGELVALVSERDQNFRLTTTDGRRFVFKIANVSEPQAATDFQVAALLHIEQQRCPVPTPRVQRTLAGKASTWIGGEDGDRRPHRCRVVSFLPGDLLSVVALSAGLAAHLGDSAARLDLALQGFAGEGDSQVLMWDLQRAGALRDILHYIEDGRLREPVRACIDDFELHVRPVLASLRRQVIHADLNPDNVLAAPTGEVAGVIDFGDMLCAPLIMEVAITAAYLRPIAGSDVLSWVRPFVAAFHAALELREEELALMFDLMRVRVAASITIQRWRASVRGAEDVYSARHLQGESDAAVFLAGLNSLGRDRFLAEILKAINIR
jgi:Ser/Thr protein kinase RdoA (MazF antagonist)